MRSRAAARRYSPGWSAVRWAIRGAVVIERERSRMAPRPDPSLPACRGGSPYAECCGLPRWGNTRRAKAGQYAITDAHPGGAHNRDAFGEEPARHERQRLLRRLVEPLRVL